MIHDLAIIICVQIIYSNTQKVGEITVEPVKPPAAVNGNKKPTNPVAAADDDDDDIDIDDI